MFLLQGAAACSGGAGSDEGESATTTGGGATTSATTTGTAGTVGTSGTDTAGETVGTTVGTTAASTTSAGTTTEGTTSTSAGTTTVGTTEDTTGVATTESPIPDMGAPPIPECSADLHAVIDGEGNILEICAPDQGCADGACVAACAAAAAADANFGCEYMLPTPPSYPPALPPCFAAFLANTWGHPAKIAVERGGVALDISVAARIATPGLAPKDWPPIPAEGIPADAVAVVFLSSDPKAIMPENQVPLTCPFTPAVNASTVIAGSGRSDAFIISADIPVTAYDILPFGGARSHFPSAELLFPTSVWGINYVAIAPPAGTYATPGPLWMQIVGLEDGTKVELRPTSDLNQGPGVNGALAGQLAAYELGRGEILQWQLPQNKLDPSGTLLLADKPVALHTGNRFLRLQPTPAPGGESAHQQNIAVTALGHDYVGAPYETRRKDLAPEEVDYRFVGVIDGTTLTFDPPIMGAPTSLDEGQVVDFATTEAFHVVSQDEKHPFALAQLMDTANLPGGSRPGATAPGYGPALGDEEFVIVLPPAQFLKRYAFFTDPTYATTNLVVTRARQDGAFAPVTVDCLGELSGWKPVGGSGDYEFTTVDLIRADIPVMSCTNGHHLAESDGPFGLVVWGLDSYSSYAYPAGGASTALSDVLVIPQ
ncbi:MAG: IgGFc-binding protein [Nannocystaceae bacterium]